jgi:hypothetical protein
MPIQKLVLGTALLALMAGPAGALDVVALKSGVEAEFAANYPHTHNGICASGLKRHQNGRTQDNW